MSTTETTDTAAERPASEDRDAIGGPAAAPNASEESVTAESAEDIVALSPAKKKMSGEVKLFIGILIGAVILGGAAIYPVIISPRAVADQGPHQVDRADINRAFLIPAGSHTKGDPNAPYSLVEFSDFQCPSCKRAIPMIEDALKNHKGQLNIVFRHFRAATTHLHSKTLGMAAEAAGMQGKFFEMSDKLFDKQDDTETATDEQVKAIIQKAAKEAGLDMARFNKDLASSTPSARYEADLAAGEKMRLRITPAYFFVPPTGKPTAISSTPDAIWWVADKSHYR